MGLEDDPFLLLYNAPNFQVTCYSLENNMEPENHLFEKGKKHYPNLHFSVLLQLFQGCKNPGRYILVLKSDLQKFSREPVCQDIESLHFTEPKGHETKGLKLYFFLLPSLKLTART